MVVVPARALVVEVRLGQRGGIGLARPAILLLAATGGPGASQSAGGLAERHGHALPVEEHSPALHQSPRLFGGALPADDAQTYVGENTDFSRIRQRLRRVPAIGVK